MNQIVRSCSIMLLSSAMLLGGSSTSFAGDVDFSYRYWLSSIDAKCGPAVVGSVSVDTVDAKDALGIQDENVSDYQLDWHLDKNHKLQFNYFSSAFAGTAIPNMKINGWDMSVGTFHTEVSAKNLQAAWVRYYDNDLTDDTRYGLVLGVRNIRIDADSTQVDGSLRFTKNFNLTFPTIGFTAETGLTGNLQGFAGLSGAYAGSRGHFYDGEAGIRTYLDEKHDVSLTAGYRLLKVKAKKDNGDKLDAKLSGPFFSAVYRF